MTPNDLGKVESNEKKKHNLHWNEQIYKVIHGECIDCKMKVRSYLFNFINAV